MIEESAAMPSTSSLAALPAVAAAAVLAFVALSQLLAWHANRKTLHIAAFSGAGMLFCMGRAAQELGTVGSVGAWLTRIGVVALFGTLLVVAHALGAWPFDGDGRRQQPISHGFALSVVVMLTAAFHDALAAGGWLDSVHLVEPTLCWVALGLAMMEQRQLQRLAVANTGVQEELVEQRARVTSAMNKVERDRDRLGVVSAAAMEGLLMHDGVRVIETNSAARSLLGSDPVGRKVSDILDVPGFDLAALLRGETSKPIPSTAEDADGNTLRVLLTGRTTKQPGDNLGVIAMKDVTETSAMRAHLSLADRLATIGTVAASTAHDLNTPMAFIHANLVAALERVQAGTFDSDKFAQLLEETLDGCERVGQLVEDLRNLARPCVDVDATCDMNEQVRIAVRLSGALVRERAALTCHFDDLPEVVGSKHRVGQVLLNLLINAAKAIPPGAADNHTITVRTRASNDMVVVTIVDTGCGIAPEHRPHIFEPFFSTRGEEGHGLGLSICHSIVSDLGGSLELAATSDAGTTFRLALPVAAEAPNEVSGVVERTLLRTARVLVVDDEPLLTRAVARALHPHEVVEAHSVEGALDRVATRPFDVILSDVRLDGASGLELHRRLREVDPSLSARIVFMSGGPSPSQARELDTLSNPRIDKPLDFDELNTAIGEVLVDTAPPRSRAESG